MDESGQRATRCASANNPKASRCHQGIRLPFRSGQLDSTLACSCWSRSDCRDRPDHQMPHSESQNRVGRKMGPARFPIPALPSQAAGDAETAVR